MSLLLGFLGIALFLLSWYYGVVSATKDYSARYLISIVTGAFGLLMALVGFGFVVWSVGA